MNTINFSHALTNALAAHARYSEAAQAEHARLQAVIDAQNKEINELVTYQGEIEAETRRLEKERNDISANYSALNKEKLRLTEECARLMNFNRNQTQTITGLRGEINMERQNVDGLRKEHDDLEKRYFDAIEARDRQARVITGLRATLNAHREIELTEIVRLRKEIENFKDYLDESREMKAKDAKLIDDVRKEHDELRDLIEIMGQLIGLLTIK